jgi:hypothetical protein
VNNALKARAERVRMLLDELTPTLQEMEREIVAAWQDSKSEDAVAREAAFRDHRALQRLQRKLIAVIKADQLENGNAG